MFAVMVYVWTCKEVTSAYVTMVLRHPKTRLCAWVWKVNASLCGLFGFFWFFLKGEEMSLNFLRDYSDIKRL